MSGPALERYSLAELVSIARTMRGYHVAAGRDPEDGPLSPRIREIEREVERRVVAAQQGGDDNFNETTEGTP